MSELKAQGGTLRATIHITRKATGLTETHELVLTPVAEPPDADTELQTEKEADHGRDA